MTSTAARRLTAAAALVAAAAGVAALVVATGYPHDEREATPAAPSSTTLVVEAAPDYLGPLRGGLPACAEEDDARPCVWVATARGNGEGRSFLVQADGSPLYVSHERAAAVLARGVPAP